MQYLLLKGRMVMGARKILLPVALAVGWGLMAAMTVADFASFAASTQAPQPVADQPVAQQPVHNSMPRVRDRAAPGLARN